MFRLADEFKRVDSQRRELLREKEQLRVRVKMVQEALERQVEQSVELRKQVRLYALLYERHHTAVNTDMCTCACLLVEGVQGTAPACSLYRPVLLYNIHTYHTYVNIIQVSGVPGSSTYVVPGSALVAVVAVAVWVFALCTRTYPNQLYLR